jgi:hypothetical protein
VSAANPTEVASKLTANEQPRYQAMAKIFFIQAACIDAGVWISDYVLVSCGGKEKQHAAAYPV